MSGIPNEKDDSSNSAQPRKESIRNGAVRPKSARPYDIPDGHFFIISEDVHTRSGEETLQVFLGRRMRGRSVTLWDSSDDPVS